MLVREQRPMVDAPLGGAPEAPVKQASPSGFNPESDTDASVNVSVNSFEPAACAGDDNGTVRLATIAVRSTTDIRRICSVRTQTPVRRWVSGAENSKNFRVTSERHLNRTEDFQLAKEFMLTNRAKANGLRAQAFRAGCEGLPR
ncbi:hypothetical protein ACTWPB_14805 [Nocardia sp. IBHARD005]|uniref:hypothetical protein n=1 Tax=Nocardia sp. IBHARD005 TaxID=3457765 RepID=UPI00405972F5